MKIEAILAQIPVRRVCMNMEMPLRAAMKLMEKEKVEALVVTDHCATEGEAVLGLLALEDAKAAVAARGPSILDARISRFVSDRYVVCDKGEMLPDAVKMIEGRAASHMLVMDRDAMIGLVTHRQVRHFVKPITGTN
ncbi:MAG: CBS domain-containing protein [Proteobacteria bacterium]|nr:CBS domain-containing protein [Pseudomonadota bacterium]MBU6425706.1 CBS domain-containing protein [Rhodospirillales bacterium]